jgi:hypothetical protein
MTKSNDEESMGPKIPCPKDVFMDEEEEGMELTAPRTKKQGCNDASNTPKKIGLA